MKIQIWLHVFMTRLSRYWHKRCSQRYYSLEDTIRLFKENKMKHIKNTNSKHDVTMREGTIYSRVKYLSIKLPAFAFAKDGCTTTCMVMTSFGRFPKGTLHWPTVLLFSKIFPAFISLMSFAALGAIFLSKTSWIYRSIVRE